MNSASRRLKKKLKTQSRSIGMLKKKLSSCTKKLKSKTKTKRRRPRRNPIRNPPRVPHSQHVALLEQQARQFQEVRTNYDNAIERYRREIERLNELLAQRILPDANADIQRQLDECRRARDDLQAMVAPLRLQIQQQQQQHEQSQQQLAQLQEQIQGFQQREIVHAQTIRELRDHIQRHELTIQQLNAQMAELQRRLDECLARPPLVLKPRAPSAVPSRPVLARAVSSEPAYVPSAPGSAFPPSPSKSIFMELNQLRQEMAQCEEERQRIQEQLRESQTSLQNREQQLELVKAQLHASRKLFRDKQVEWLNARDVNKGKDVAHQRALSDLQEQLARATMSGQVTLQQKQQVEAQLQQAREQVEQIRLANDRAKATLEANLTRVNREYDARLNKHAVESETLKTQVRQASADVQRMTQQLQQAHSENQHSRQQFQALQTRLEQQQAELSTLKDRLIQANRDLGHTRMDNLSVRQAHEQRIQELQAQLDERTRMVRQLEQHIRDKTDPQKEINV
jgi:chromosome segregation ATPase